MEQRVAAYAVIVEAGKVLLPHWNESGHSAWTLPGGGIDWGEDPADAAVREVLEETGFVAVLDELLGIDSLVIPAEERFEPGRGPAHAIRIVYRAHVVGGELRDEPDGSTDKAAWFELAEVDDLERVELVDTGLRWAGYPG